MGNSVQLPFFPVPAEGETVFSVVGRCAERLGIATQELMVWLTGQARTVTLYSALPGHLAKIAAAMPPGHPWQDVEHLIHNHTALGYFSFFHPPEKRAAFANLLAHQDASHPITLALGLTAYRTPAVPKSPRFCLDCTREQAEQLGFAYFRLEHQLPGVSVCWKHGHPLYHGCVHCGPYPLPRKRLTMPRQCLCSSFEPLAIEAEETSPEKIWLAANSALILAQVDDQKTNRFSLLRSGIMAAGFRRKSNLHYAKIADAIESRFGTELLTKLNYPAWSDDRPTTWLRNYFHKGKDGRHIATLPGLLIVSAAFESIETFRSGQLLPTKGGSRVSGSSPTQPVWTGNLAQSLLSHTYRISACAKALGVHSNVVAAEAQRQGIAIPLSPKTVNALGQQKIHDIKAALAEGTLKRDIMARFVVKDWTLTLIEISDPSLAKLRTIAFATSKEATHKADIVRFLATQTNASITLVAEKLPGAYQFLLRTDRNWLKSTLPTPRPKGKGGGGTRYDWEAIDRKLAIAIRQSACDMLAGDGKPQRVTSTALLIKHSALQRFSSNRKKLPLTKKMLKEVAEPADRYLLRKVTWGIKQLVTDQQEITLDNLRIKAAVSDIRLKPLYAEIREITRSLGGRVSMKSKLAR